MTDLDERLREELDRLDPPDLASAVDARLAEAPGRVRPDPSAPAPDRRRIALVAATVVLLAVPVAFLLRTAFRPGTEPPPAATETTLGLRLFVDGRILEVSDGETRVVAEWPAPAAPFTPPVEGDFGIVGLGYGRSGVDLWWWSEGIGPERLAAGTSQSFAMTSEGSLSYGLVDHTTMASTQLVMTDLPGRSSETRATMPGYVAPVGFVGAGVAVTTGDGGAVGGALWDGSQIVDLPENGPLVTHPALGYAVVRFGDGGCWDIVRVSETRVVEDAADADCSFVPQAFAASGAQLAGIEGSFDEERSQPRANRVVVADVASRAEVFRSEPIRGVRQVAWEDDERLLVLARTEPGSVSVFRCDVPSRRCAEVWTIDTDADRYNVWLVVRALGAGGGASFSSG